MMRLLIVFSLLFMILSGCASRTETDVAKTTPITPSAPLGRYSMQNDAFPDNPPDVSQVPDAVPRYEPHSRGGNRSPYTVFGNSYTVLPSANGYREKGIASWYGQKFQGHLTSNGEVYDMFEMTAAHKSLPLPTFARVTNLDNGRSVVVRVNDRGPFHNDRLIDLSYAAAYRLDILKQGTGRVEVTAITLSPDYPMMAATVTDSAATYPSSNLSMRASLDRQYLQVGAFSTEEAARRARHQLQQLDSTLNVGIYPASPSGSTVYRVKIGPLAVGDPLDRLLTRLAGVGFYSPQLVSGPR